MRRYEVRPFLSLVVFACLAAPAAENSPLWLRYPAISPDGQTLLFVYKGDIWSVPAAGGHAIPLTVSESYEFAPVRSHDGKSVAFAYDRYGNFDVSARPRTAPTVSNRQRRGLCTRLVSMACRFGRSRRSNDTRHQIVASGKRAWQ